VPPVFLVILAHARIQYFQYLDAGLRRHDAIISGSYWPLCYFSTPVRHTCRSGPRPRTAGCTSVDHFEPGMHRAGAGMASLALEKPGTRINKADFCTGMVCASYLVSG